jgi:hypothetical protein
LEIDQADFHIPSAPAAANLTPIQKPKGAFPSLTTPPPSGSSFNWKRLRMPQTAEEITAQFKED